MKCFVTIPVRVCSSIVNYVVWIIEFILECLTMENAVAALKWLQSVL